MELKIVKNTEDVVLVEVIFEDPIDRMSQRGFSGKENFIKVTKGKTNTITLYDSEYNPYYNFKFGNNGHTVISEDTTALKDKVLDFLLSQRIQIQNQTSKLEKELEIVSPTKGFGMSNHYCVHLGGELARYFETEEEIKALFGDYSVYEKTTVHAGATMYKATLRKTNAELFV